MSKKILVISDKGPNKRRFFLSEPTHLGRYDHVEWAVRNRQIPMVFKDLKVAIEIYHDIFISRNHAGILPSKNGSFFVVDLNSRNGIYLNGARVPSETSGRPRVTLSKGDVIALSSYTSFSVENVGESVDGHIALLVGNEGGNLRGVHADLEELTRKLSTRGFAGNIHQLYNSGATCSAILGRLDEIAYSSVPDSHFFFHYSGHGNEKGLCAGEKELTPDDLFSRLRNIRGKKAVVLDCCHAGIFIDNPLLIPEHTLLLLASSREGPAYEKKTERAGGAFMGRFTAALVKYLDAHREEIDLQAFGEILKTAFNDQVDVKIYQPQAPSIHGDRFTVFSSYSSPIRSREEAK